MTLNQATARALLDAVEAATGKTVGRSAHVLGTSRKSLSRAKSEGMAPKRAARLLRHFNKLQPKGDWVNLAIEFDHGGIVCWKVIRDYEVHDQGAEPFMAED